MNISSIFLKLGWLGTLILHNLTPHLNPQLRRCSKKSCQILPNTGDKEGG